MPLAKDRELTSITTKAHLHMKRIVAAYNKRGLPENNMHWLSELILSQPVPTTNGNGKAHIVGNDQPVNITGEISGVTVGKPDDRVKVKVKAEAIELSVEGEE